MKICDGIQTLIGPDGPDRWTEQIRHIDMYQTRQDNAHVRVLSDPCGEEGDRQVNGWFSEKAGAAPMCIADINTDSTLGQVRERGRDVLT